MSRGFLRKSSVNTFIGIVWILFAVGTSAQNAVSKFRADSIRQSLSRIQKPQDKIPLLKELIGLYWQLPEEVPALKEIIDIAMPLDSIGIVYDAMAGLPGREPLWDLCRRWADAPLWRSHRICKLKYKLLAVSFLRLRAFTMIGGHLWQQQKA